MSFSELGLDPLILKSVLAAGYENATPVQQQAIPAALSGGDLLVSSHTGSGKTAAFLLPSIQRLLAEPAVKSIGPRVLVLTPTRELALQVEKAAMTYGKEMRRFRTACLVGGAPYGLQLKRLSQPVDVVVATPGRLIDHLERGKIDFSRLEVLVLDEADRMLDMGFVDDIKAIAARCPAERQTLLFSATLDGVVGNLARELTRDAQRIEIEAVPHKEAKIEQRLLFADNMDHKNRLLDALLRDVEMVQAIVFASTKRSTEEISDLLAESGFASDALHGDMQQGQRNRALQRLREGRTRVLVATDVAARGIDVASISHVINFDLPRQAEDYVHRIGRTGRAGRTGIAVSFAGMREGGLVKNIERYTGNRIEVHTLPGLEPTQRPSTGRPGNGRPRGNGPRGGYEKRSFGDRSEPRSYGDRPRGDSRDNRDRGYRGDARRNDGAPARRFDNGVRGPSDVPRMTSEQTAGPRGAASKPEVNGNSVEYWEKREREAKAKAATGRSYGDRGNAARPARGYGNENRGGAGRGGVRGRFKD
ncbi:DEAD/DEAH box helicase [Thiobacillus denitrificans ATCC 25259]|uniref:DEAD/DEAH box helicase n=1 Tax=Thiobacillus denitrificans (strain ATCC 25259 / T1) TaxID=292415 RepID=Q3SF48_THIDA|nr:DEAD/DEAH box helicase [Thiobacillus denitrificans]AAZ98768.1 DEAD/DEAH box helicase [Thiobacillus denitrificans ATCC 25259]